MTELDCDMTRGAFSGYLDGAISGRQMQAMARHMARCEGCAGEFAEWRAMHLVLGQMGAAKPPANLGLKLRLATSREILRRQTLKDAISMRWQNILRPLLMQVSAGMAATVLLVGTIAMLLGAAPEAVLANDEPLAGMRDPRYLYSAGPARTIETPANSTLVIEAQVNSLGRVYDYEIVSGPVDEATRLQLMDRLMLEVFAPAEVFGAPVRGRVVLTFSGVSVRG